MIFQLTKMTAPLARGLNRYFSTVAASTAPKILITGSNGQIGMELAGVLRTRYSPENVITTDLTKPAQPPSVDGPSDTLDVLDTAKLNNLIKDHKITKIIHLASLLSAVGEKNPLLAMKVNARGIENVLEAAREHKLQVFAPSTIAVFGASTPQDMTPDETIMRPSTMYGVTKVYLELLGEYYHKKFGVDFRSVRFPGVISNVGPPGGGTTDYAVDIYHQAVLKGSYTCFLRSDSTLPMMYMPDTLHSIVTMLEAPSDKMKQRVYNITGMSFTPAQLAASIKKYMPNFKIDYQPDFRQAIADSWPRSLDDSHARMDWGWNPQYNIDTMTQDMLTVLSKKYTKN